mgnify:CR=1 FL=1
MIFQAKNFSTREELENEIRNKIGLTPDKKNDTIRGTREELERLHLSDRSIFWGIKCVITDSPSVIKTQAEIEKPQRGEIKKFGINLEK